MVELIGNPNVCVCLAAEAHTTQAPPRLPPSMPAAFIARSHPLVATPHVQQTLVLARVHAELRALIVDEEGFLRDGA